MKDRDFSARVKKIFALQKKSPLKAAREFMSLAKRYERASKQSISRWHVEQALGLAAMAFEKSGNSKEELDALTKRTELHRGELQYHGHCFATALANLSLAHFSAGETDKGIKYAYESLRYFSDYPEPSHLIERLGHELKKHRKQ